MAVGWSLLLPASFVVSPAGVLLGSALVPSAGNAACQGKHSAGIWLAALCGKGKDSASALLGKRSEMLGKATIFSQGTGESDN